MYHHYTVDEHTIRAVEAIAEMEQVNAERVPLATEIFQLVENRRALYLAMLLHDTGKGKGDQQIEGMKTATRACQRLGIPEDETELVAWLVGNHLELSETAQKRDISDPRTVTQFANLVGSLERLRLLYILTAADIRAVGPGVWNAWKGQLMADLYHNTAAALRGGRADESGVQAHLEARAEARRESVVEELGSIPHTLLEMETAYWTGFDVPDLTWHATALKEGGSVVCYRFPPEGGALTLMVCGEDRPGLFADLAGTLANLGANVVSAQVFTNRSGRILDIFILQDGSQQPYGLKDASRLQRLETALEQTLSGTSVKEPAAARMGRREAAFLVQPSAQIRNDVSTEYTVVDIAGRDRPGLLYDVASVLAESDLSIHSAHVGSYGERMFDAFYVQTAAGEKLTDADRIETLKERLLDALGQHEPDAPETPARKLKRSRAVDSF
tara:strand:- start:785 stop:2116 length:1332 start_codon:yes stop_codon:yes gene_type:complete